MSSSDNEYYDNPYEYDDISDPMTQLSEENERLRNLVGLMLPELKLRLKGLQQCWPGEEINVQVKLTNLIIRAEHALSVP